MQVVFSVAGENPFTPKGFLVRYWKKQISNNLPPPPFLLDKASPLTAAQLAVFSRLAGDLNSFSYHLPDFCTKANLLCFPDLSQSLKKHRHDVNFTSYGSKNFTNYGSGRVGSANSFRNYSDGYNGVSNNFRRYSRDATGHSEDFTSYAESINIPDQSFAGYGTTSTGGEGHFRNYDADVNVPNLRFTAYSDNSNGRKQAFTEYTNAANSGDEGFTSYGKNGNGAGNEFKNYGNNSNVIRSNFMNYGYARDGNTFSGYNNESTVKLAARGKMVNKWAVEPGKFFREGILKSGSIMPMPDIRDKMAKRSFLPRAIITNIPFSSSEISELKKIFHAGENSSMAKMMSDTLGECERAPSPGETKRCVASIEDMVDFATAMLGRDVVVRTTENTQGSNGNIMIGEVKGVNDGNVTKSVSCHQSLFPYLLYYCHSVPKVRVYEVDILDPKLEARINRGVAICHLDTSSWSPGHGAFVALGSSPGLIEVCHWIFENDMTWTVAD
ncbi:polygalacturonase-1 non-catalytic subunit beta [Phtheirospermum japonicum]|uniref:Polygalacturonase-1 non-catalytic subunit beta n=1 Tax=Phtheirospermum japonicum TaxID=374723 RepID=A0A830B3G3_9LAMI|nr:polygalacturonase-1 non-catalytic subunit beta [Phtheirospermum japonicum]